MLRSRAHSASQSVRQGRAGLIRRLISRYPWCCTCKFWRCRCSCNAQCLHVQADKTRLPSAVYAAYSHVDALMVCSNRLGHGGMWDRLPYSKRAQQGMRREG